MFSLIKLGAYIHKLNFLNFNYIFKYLDFVMITEDQPVA